MPAAPNPEKRKDIASAGRFYPFQPDLLNPQLPKPCLGSGPHRIWSHGNASLGRNENAWRSYIAQRSL